MRKRTIDRGKILSDWDVAEQLHIERETLAQWRRAGRGPAHLKIGKKVFYFADDVRDWIAAQRRVPSAA